MYKHHVDPSGHFYLNAVRMMSDADQLVKALRESKYFWALLRSRNNKAGVRCGEQVEIL